MHPPLVLGVLVSCVLGGGAWPRGAPVGPDDEVRRALALVRELRDAAPAAVLKGLAEVHTREALDALLEATNHLETPAALQLVYGLVATYCTDREFAEHALAALEREALGPNTGRWLPATEGLVAAGDPGVDALGRVFERSTDPAVRASALGPLMPGLRLAGSVAGLDQILASWRQPESGAYETAVRTLAAFRGDEHLRRFERALGDPRTSPELRGLVLDALTRMSNQGADGVLVRVLECDDDALRVAAIQALEARGVPGCERYLERLTDSGATQVRAAAWIALAGRVPEDSRYRRRLALLADHDDSTLRVAAAVVLGRARFEGSVDALIVLLADDEWRVRDAALDACLDQRDRALVPALIARCDAEAPARRDRVRDTLVGLTAVDHGASSARWRAWWDREGKDLPLATAEAAQAFLDARPRAEAGAGRSTAQFYGIPLTSNRVVFVVDASGSMSAGTGQSRSSDAPVRTRIEVAKAELMAVVERLEPRARFNIVWFASGTSAWRARLAERTPANLRSARRFVEERRADGATALYDGLVTAWRDRDVEAIYLLSDGAPSAGRLVQPEAILADVRARFASKPVTVHCISVGTASPLLEAIAGATGGLYRVVD
jgi:Mg-chelatase subunit ChlD